MSTVAIKCRSVSCIRGGLPVLQGVDFTLETGSALILRGPNGSGKTTLLRCLAGLQPVAAGQVDLDEDAVAYVGHANGAKAALTVRENLQFWAQMCGGGDVEAVLDEMNLAALQDRPAANLSAGQARRLGLSRLLVSGCPIWLLDEPTVALDSASVLLFGQVLKDHLANGGSAILTTHIDLGVDAPILDVSAFQPDPGTGSDFDEAFL